MAPRSNWKGYLKLSLVSASIAIYPATSATEKVSFNTLNRATGNRLKRQMVDAVTGDIVESDEQVKGYAVAKDQYVMVEADELAEIAIESSHTIDIEKFVPKASIDDRYRDTPVLLGPRGQGRPGSVRRHPRCHEEKEDGGHRPHRHGPARAHHDARAVRQRA